MYKLLLFLSVYLCFIKASLAVENESAPKWKIKFTANKLNVTMTKQITVGLVVSELPTDLAENSALQVIAAHPDLLHINLVIPHRDIENNEWRGNVTMEGLFLGQTDVYVLLLQDNKQTQRAADTLHVIVLRNVNGLDTAFKLIVGSFVMILYINFGAVVDPKALKGILLRPVGPCIGFASKFLMMPVLGYLIGKFMFPDQPDLRLGLFFTAVTPAGGSSNIFTALLDGNLNLSVTMTALSNLLAFVMMPIWIFSLGAVIFNEAQFKIPYAAIATTSFSLVLPLTIGMLLQKYRPQYVSGLVRYLKTFALILMLAIMIFAFYVNSYMFKIFTVEILFAGAALSWSGYLFGYLIAILLRQSQKDALTIAIETGIENTGIAIFMLNFTLPQPSADITSAVPVANSVMTPMPLLALLIIRKLRQRCSKADTEELSDLNKEAMPVNQQALDLAGETDFEAQAIMKHTKEELKVL